MKLYWLQYTIAVTSISIYFTLTACAPRNSPSFKDDFEEDRVHTDVIYGRDDRMDLYQVTDQKLLEKADSAVALVKNYRIKKGANTSILESDIFEKAYNLCSSEPFRKQPLAPFCSGFYVGEDSQGDSIIITAGHCITSKSDCRNTSFVFGFEIKARADDPTVVSNDNVYKCKSIVKQFKNNSGADYAVLKVKRKIANHKALKVRRSGSVKVNDELYVIGHPVGLPKKIAGNASVRKISREHFSANLDTYGGNSGSAVFNAHTGEVEGILVRGETDFKFRGGCRISYECKNDTCRGEDVTKITELVKYIPHLKDEIEESLLTPMHIVNNANKSIPDNNKAGITSVIVAPQAPQGRAVKISVNIRHSWKGDLKVKVVAPDGRSAVLHSRSGSYRNNITGTYGLNLRPATTLNTLKGVSTAGEWKLIVSDEARRDLGVLRSWALVID